MHLHVDSLKYMLACTSSYVRSQILRWKNIQLQLRLNIAAD